MDASETARDPIPENFETVDELDEFWSTHSFADYDDLLREVHFNILLEEGEKISIDPLLAEEIRKHARRRNISVDELVNQWLSEKLKEAA